MSPSVTLNLYNKTCQLAGYIHKACYLGNWLIVKFISFSGTENPEFCCTTHTPWFTLITFTQPVWH